MTIEPSVDTRKYVQTNRSSKVKYKGLCEALLLLNIADKYVNPYGVTAMYSIASKQLLSSIASASNACVDFFYGCRETYH